MYINEHHAHTRFSSFVTRSPKIGNFRLEVLLEWDFNISMLFGRVCFDFHLVATSNRPICPSEKRTFTTAPETLHREDDDSAEIMANRVIGVCEAVKN